MRLHDSTALTFDDVLLVPQHSDVLPQQVQLQTQLGPRLPLQVPLLSAAMDTVTESRLAIAMAQAGGLGIVQKNMSIAAQAQQVKSVKKFESGVVKDPITVSPDTTIAALVARTRAHGISGVPVVMGDALIGIVTGRDIRFETQDNLPVSEVMTPKERLITVREGTSHEAIIRLLHTHRIEKILVVDAQFRLKGLITAKDIRKAAENPWATKDYLGRLQVGAAIGIGPDTQDRAAALVEAGADTLVVDTAHGHSQSVLDTVARLKQAHPHCPLIAGNIATHDAARALVGCGADAVKVGIGPGSICTTRVIAGVGVPQITAISEVARAVADTPVGLIADGGIRHSGDVVKALAAGADAVMLGSLLAGTEEAPGDVELLHGRSYKTYRGMGSLGAMADGSADRYFQHHHRQHKRVPEGIEGRVPYKGPLSHVIHQLLGGLQSGMGYVGAAHLPALRERAVFMRITASGFRESHVHDVRITKEAPNYQGQGD